MPLHIEKTAVVSAESSLPRTIEAFVGRLDSGQGEVFVAHMESEEGWTEPGQSSEFMEISVVLRGTLRVEHAAGFLDVTAGGTVVIQTGEWVSYSTPLPGGADYLVLCVPSFTALTVQRDEDECPQLTQDLP